MAQREEERDQAAKALTQSPLPAADGIAFDSANRTLLSRHVDGSTRAWNAVTGAPLPEENAAARWELERQIGNAAQLDSPLTKRVNAVAFSPDGKLLATGSGDPSRSGELKVWDTTRGSLVREIPKAHKDAVLALDFSSDGKLLASGAADRAVRLWEVDTGKLFRNLEAHANHVLSVSLRSDGRRVLSAGSDNSVKSWDIFRSDVVATFSNFPKEVGFARYMGRGDEFFAASMAPVLRVLRDSGSEVRSTTEGLPRLITAAALSGDGKLQFVGDASGSVRVLNPEGKVILQWNETER
jgi:WD40 repeat protein